MNPKCVSKCRSKKSKIVGGSLMGGMGMEETSAGRREGLRRGYHVGFIKQCEHRNSIFNKLVSLAVLNCHQEPDLSIGYNMVTTLKPRVTREPNIRRVLFGAVSSKSDSVATSQTRPRKLLG